MNATVIDTLRFANRLKEAGVDPRQAEAMSRAYNDELTEGVATKRDLDNAVTELKGEVAREVAKLDAKVEAMDAKFEGRFLAVDARFEGMETRFESMDAKIDGLAEKFANQSRHVFLVLALIAALGLYNAAAPHFIGKQSGTVTTAQTQPGTVATAKTAPSS